MSDTPQVLLAHHLKALRLSAHSQSVPLEKTLSGPLSSS
jgi:hypothetical protein